MCKFYVICNCVCVVENIFVCKYNIFWKFGGIRGVLYIYYFIWFKVFLFVNKFFIRNIFIKFNYFVLVVYFIMIVLFNKNEFFKIR